MLNKVTLIGRLGADPELRYMPNGGAVTNISLATTRRYKDRQKQKQEETEWHRVGFFNRLAEIVGEYCRKGSLVYIEGRIRTRKWKDNNGDDRYTTEIIAESMQMLGSKGQGTGQSVPQSTSSISGQASADPLDDFDDVPF